MEERPEPSEGTSQAKNKKRSVLGREAREYGQSLRHRGSGAAVRGEMGVVGS